MQNTEVAAQQDNQKAAQDTARLCKGVRDLAQQAIGWLSHDVNRNVVGQRQELLLRQMRQTSRQAARLETASTSPVSIAVYGASQAGKSFLVAHLAAPPASGDGAPDRSAAVLPHAREGGVSFLEINPTGGRESTGLVTRFTTRPIAGDRQFPVNVRLLSVLDLVKIMASCYFVDIEQSEESELDHKEVEQLLVGLQGAGGVPVKGLSGDDIHELKEYCRRWLHLRNNIRVLDAAQYWERLAGRVEQLDLDGLTRILEVLWGRVPDFTEMFRKLHVGLQQLGFASEVQCGQDALLPRADPADPNRALTIIDVDTLKRLLGTGSEPLQVRHPSGLATLDRPVVTALAAELVLNLHGRTRPFLDRIDLLDFPGARTRGGIRRGNLTEEKGKPESIFLRGKVAHLFERYRDEYDLTSMILCVGPSAQEVGTLPKLINDWVEATHGDTSEKRRNADTALFLVLTKFDGQFVGQEGQQANDATAMSVRWSNRIKSTIGDFLAQDGNWTTQWRPGQPFNNVFWYRSPFVDQKHMFDYGESESKRETGLRPDVARTIGQLRQQYEQVDLVRRHFAEPEKAWEAALTLNDGGISYLADAIAAISRKNVKIGQIRARALGMAQQMRAELKQYFFDEDPDSQLRARQGKADQLLREIGECYGRGLFGRLLSQFQLEQDELAQLARSVRLREETQGQAGARISGGRGPNIADEILGLGLETADQGPQPLDCRDIETKRVGLDERFACRAVSRWVERIDGTCQNQDLLAYFGLTHEGAQTLASELVAGIRRCNVAGNVADRVRRTSAFVDASADLGVWSPALSAATMVNDFVNTLAIDGDAAKSQADDRDQPVLAEAATDYDRDFCIAWIRAFKAFVSENAKSKDGQNYNAQQNASLGRILNEIGSIAAE